MFRVDSSLEEWLKFGSMLARLPPDVFDNTISRYMDKVRASQE